MALKSPIVRAAAEPWHLAALATASVVLFVTGFPVPILVVLLALEALYLVGFAHSTVYKRRLKALAGESEREEREGQGAQHALKLRKDERRRFQALQKEIAALRPILEKAGGGTIPVDVRRLEGLEAAALEFCLALQNFRDILSRVDEPRLKEELADLLASTPAGQPSDTTRSQAAALLQQRLAHLDAVREQQEVLDTQLRVIEQTLALVMEQASTQSVRAELPPEVEHLVRDVEVARKTLHEMQQLEKSDFQ